jgi:pimeloyl-ACP methyl ester carboxylesterase
LPQVKNTAPARAAPAHSAPIIRAMATTCVITGPGGRALEVHVAGPDDARVVLFHDGTPGDGTLFAPLVQDGAARGLRHVSYARPGYAGSDRHEGRAVADCAADVTAIADALGIGEFFTVGVSGGGPHALACAALLGERVLAAASIAGVAPYGAHGLDWTAGMGQENIDEAAAADAGPEELRAYLEREGEELAGASAADLHVALDGLLCDVDRNTLGGPLAEHFADSTRRALANGVWGWLDDDLELMGDWGFDLGAVAAPVTIWHGRQDRFVPFAHGQWLAANVRGARAQLLDDHGHLSLSFAGYGDVLDGLLAD